MNRLRFRKPSAQVLDHLRAANVNAPFSYAETGCSSGVAPAGYAVDHYRVWLGSGSIVFQRARQELRSWRMLRLGWVQPCWPSARIKQGELVGVQARVFSLWTINVCRIVQVIEKDGPVAQYGFAYGTLVGHLERGEERFLVEWDRADDSVWYDIRAVSRPGSWLTWLTYPLARRLQRRFGRDSLRSMAKAVK